MRKLIVSMNVSLDGFMAGAHGELDWHFPFWNGEMSAYATRLLQAMDTIILGRITYQNMAAHWPHVRDDAFAAMMNNYTKIVFSRSLTKLGWKNSQIAEVGIKEEISTLKKEDGKNIIIYGSGTIVKSCIQFGLVDEYRIWVHPVIIGNGRPLFKGLKGKIDLRLVNIDTFCTGVAVLNYHSELGNLQERQAYTIFHDSHAE